MALRFNAARLVADCGGVQAFADLFGRTRTWPYRMMSSGYVGTPTLARILEIYPDLKLNDYFEDRNEPTAKG